MAVRAEMSRIAHTATANPSVSVPDSRRRELDELVLSVGRRGFRIARDLLGSDAEAEDAVQEALARACESIARVREPDALRAWFYRVLTNLCMRTLRRRRVRQVAFGWLSRAPEPTSSAVSHTSDVRALLDALAALPPRQHTALVLRYGHDLTVSEVAQMLGVKTETAKTHMARGMRRLREALDVES